MDDFELQPLRQQPKWVAVLEHYHALQIQHRERSSEFDGWIPRAIDIPIVENVELSGIHGKLIAFGYLKFDLGSRDEGIRYQLTPLGKQGINLSERSDEELSSDGDESDGLRIHKQDDDSTELAAQGSVSSTSLP